MQPHREILSMSILKLGMKFKIKQPLITAYKEKLQEVLIWIIVLTLKVCRNK